MIRVYKKDIISALNESELYSSAFVRKTEGEKTPVKTCKTCVVGDVIRRSKSFSHIEEFQEACRDVRHPIYEQGFLAMFRENHKHIQKLNLKPGFTPLEYKHSDHRVFVIDYYKEKDLYLSLLSSEFEFLMESTEYETPASAAVKKEVLQFVQVNVPVLVKEN